MDEVVSTLLASPSFAKVIDNLRDDLVERIDGLKKDISLMRENQSEMQASISAFENKMRANRREMDSALRKLEKDSSRVSGSIDQIAGISDRVEELTTEVRLKASQKEINAVENRFNFVCTSSQAQRMQLSIDDKASTREVTEVQEAVNEWKEAVSKDFCLKSDLQQEVDRMNTEWKAQAAEFAKESDCVKRDNGADRALKLMNKHFSLEVTALAHRLAETAAAVSQLDSRVMSKPPEPEVSSLKEMIGGFCTTADLEAVKANVSTIIETWEARVNGFRETIAGQERVLARYDEVLLEKASKLDCLEVSSHVKALLQLDLETRLSDLARRSKDTSDACKLLTDRVTTAEGSVADAVQTVKGLKCDRKDIAFLKERVMDMEEQLLMKADRVDLIGMLERKASCEDVQTTLQSIDILHRLLKMSAVLINHTLKGVFSKCCPDSKPLDPGRRDWLLKHSEIIVKWANDFSPLQTGNMVPEEMFVLPPPSPMMGRSPTPDLQSFSAAHRRLKTRAVKLPSIDTSF